MFLWSDPQLFARGNHSVSQNELDSHSTRSIVREAD